MHASRRALAIPSIRRCACVLGDDVHAVQNADDEPPNPITIKSIEFRDVVFHYPTKPDVPVLRGPPQLDSHAQSHAQSCAAFAWEGFAGISLSIKEKQKVALVGESGSGKSTIVQLLERFYDPIRGSIFVNGEVLPSFPSGTHRCTHARSLELTHTQAASTPGHARTSTQHHTQGNARGACMHVHSLSVRSQAHSRAIVFIERCGDAEPATIAVARLPGCARVRRGISSSTDPHCRDSCRLQLRWAGARDVRAVVKGEPHNGAHWLLKHESAGVAFPHVHVCKRLEYPALIVYLDR